MLTLTIPKQEVYDETTSTFYPIEEQKLHFEHSLYAVSKWESKWHVPFLDGKEKNMTQIIDYVRCMCLDEDVDPITFKGLTRKNLKTVEEYIANPMTATWIREDKKIQNGQKAPSRGKAITSELLYFYMSQAQIPYECQFWHLNRLVMLIRVSGEELKPKKKMSKKSILEQQRSLNQARRARLGSKG